MPLSARGRDVDARPDGDGVEEGSAVTTNDC